MYKSVKERKEFIVDMLIVNAAVSTLEVALNSKDVEGIKNVHQNKHRKELKKVKEVYEKFNSQKELIWNLLDKRDLQTISHKMIERIRVPFLEEIAYPDKELNLFYLAIYMLRKRFAYSKRKINHHLNMFKDSKLIYGVVFENIEKATNHTLEDELEAAERFVSRIRY